MNKKTSKNHIKESDNEKVMDPKLWDRLIWQEALNKAIKRDRNKRLQKHVPN